MAAEHTVRVTPDAAVAAVDGIVDRPLRHVRHGVDFSGGRRPGAKTWIATLEGDRITLAHGPDHRALVARIAATAERGEAHTWLIDAPFGLPLETLREQGVELSWTAAARWLRGFESPREWRRACRTQSRREPRRTTDRAARTPMAPMNLRVFRQTWSLIVNVLLPLSERGIRIEPVAGPPTSPVTVAEGCPASVLHRRGWPARGYKGAGDPPRDVRRRVEQLLRASGLPLTPRISAQAIDDEEGDALDALLLLLEPEQTVVPAEALVEGWVY